MDSKAVNIYAYKEGFTDGVFFYNGNMSTRDAVLDVLRLDDKEASSPKYDGYKITEIDGITGEEAEVFTSPKGYGNGVLITGQRIKEQYIDITAIGAGDLTPEEYYQFALDFHVPGMWYILNIQYLGTWHRAKALLTNVKVTPGNVFRRQEVVVSYLIPDIKDEEYWKDDITKEDLPTWSFYLDENETYTDTIEVPLESAGWPMLRFKFTANENEEYTNIEHEIKLAVKIYYIDPNTRQEASMVLTNKVGAFVGLLDFTNGDEVIDGNPIINRIAGKSVGFAHECHFKADGSYATALLNTKPTKMVGGGAYYCLETRVDGLGEIHREWITQADYLNTSTSGFPSGGKITRIEYTITHTESIKVEITWSNGVS